MSARCRLDAYTSRYQLDVRLRPVRAICSVVADLRNHRGTRDEGRRTGGDDELAVEEADIDRLVRQEWPAALCETDAISKW